MLSPAEKALLALMIFTIMMGMGATLTFSHFKEVVKQPKGILIGLLSQFGWMPVIAAGLAYGLDLAPAFALGLILVGCTPGGTTSNLFTYFSKGNVALSVVMTVASTFCALLMMPLLLGVYAASFLEGTDLTIPTENVVSTLVIVLVPVFIGMGIRAKFEGFAKKVEKTASITGMVVIVYLIATWVPRNHDLIFSTPITVYAGALGIGLAGFTLGYLTSKLLGLSAPVARTVSLETGIQNTPLTFAIILASFPAAKQNEILWLPLLYAVAIVILSSFVTLGFRMTLRSEEASIAAGHEQKTDRGIDQAS